MLCSFCSVLSLFFEVYYMCNYAVFFLNCTAFVCSMAYLSFEESKILDSKTKFSDYKFFQAQGGQDRVSFMEQLIHTIPQLDHLVTVPDGINPEREEDLYLEKKKQRKKLSPSEMSKLPKEAKILIMSDGRKATAVANFLLDNFNRKLLKGEDTQHNMCLYESVLCQISNRKEIIGPDGECYSPLDLKLQTIYNMVTNYEKVYPVIEKHLTNSYKQFTLKNLLTTSEVEIGMLAAIRELIQVKKKFHFFNINRQNCTLFKFYYAVF